MSEGGKGRLRDATHLKILFSYLGEAPQHKDCLLVRLAAGPLQGEERRRHQYRQEEQGQLSNASSEGLILLQALVDVRTSIFAVFSLKLWLLNSETIFKQNTGTYSHLRKFDASLFYNIR